MFRTDRLLLMLTLIAIAALAGVFAALGTLKPVSHWKWTDLAGEGGTALLAGLWAATVASSRPGGRVTMLLTAGLLSIMFGAWIDCLDEIFKLPAEMRWDNWAEALLMPGGMLLVTFGLYAWRGEQLGLSEVLRKRERVFRDHRSFDRVALLHDAAYLRRQMQLERERHRNAECTVVLLDIDGLGALRRQHGRAEADRALQAVAHQLLLNMRDDDLLCRFAANRLALLLPGTPPSQGRGIAEHLCRMVALMRHYPHGQQLAAALHPRVAFTRMTGDADAVLRELNAALEQPADTALAAH